MKEYRVKELEPHSATRALTRIWGIEKMWGIQKWNEKLMIWDLVETFYTKEDAEKALEKLSNSQK